MPFGVIRFHIIQAAINHNFEVCERLDSLGYGLDTEVQCHLDPEFMSLSIPDGAFV